MEVTEQLKRVYTFGDKKAEGNSKMKNLLGVDNGLYDFIFGQTTWKIID